VEQPGTNTALLVIDVQRGLFEHPTPIHEANALLANINLLIDRAHAAHVPVVYIQHSTDKVLLEGTDEWKLHPDIQPLPTDLMIRKHHGNSFEETPLKAELDRLHVGKLVIVGLTTHGCVQATCAGAHELGYDTVLVKDAHSDYYENARTLIDEYNEKASKGSIVRLQTTAEVNFGAAGTK
jgi:nicotinamidase-related amidase